MTTIIAGEEATKSEKRRIFPSYPNITFDEKYKKEWKNILKILESSDAEDDDGNGRIGRGLEYLKELAFAGELKISRFRSLHWSLLLRVISDSPDHWIEEKNQQRTKYKKLKEEFIRNPHDGDKNDNPLSESKQSVWNQYFRDQELLSVIRQDVVRTFPGVDFFRKPSIQESMLNILFYYAREHPYMCYRQGMHEILAPILFVLYYDYQNYQEILSLSDIDEKLKHIMDKNYFEADSYSIFSRLMTSIEAYYRMPNLTPTAEGHFPAQIEKLDGNLINTEVEIVRQLNYIKEKILIKEDLHLHNHLNKLDIPPHIYGIRWLRLLFGREFSLQDLLILWDAIFADSDKFELPNYIFAAMLIRIRDKLLLSDYTTCLSYLMRYPNNIDIGLIIKHALYMQNPKKYERPPNAIVYVTIKPSDLNQAQKCTQFNTKLPLKNTNNSPKHILRNNNNNNSKNSNSSSSKTAQQRERSFSIAGETSFSNNKEFYHHIDLKEILYSNSLNAAKYANYGVISNSDTKIIDGYREDSPQFLRLELNNAQTVMKISKMKLEEYLIILRSHVGRTDSEKVNQALDGIEELCAFLDVKPISVHNSISQPIDSASEANEHASTSSSAVTKQDEKDKKSNEILKHIPSSTVKITHKKMLSELESKREFVKQLISSQDFQNIDEMAESVISSSSLINSSSHLPLQPSKSNSNEAIMNINKKNIRYEVPDNGFMEKSLKILGHKKEVELKIFKEDNNRDKQKRNTNEGIGRGLPEPDPIGLREEK